MPEAAEPEVVLEFENVALQFEDKVVLRDISFRLQRGETKVILGVAATGTSVMLKLAVGLLQPDSGRIFALGQEITGLSEKGLFPVRRKIGMVFQESALFDSLTVGENVSYVFDRMPEVSPQEVQRRV